MATYRKMPSGRIQAIVRKKGAKPISKTFRTKGQANVWARSVEDQIDQGSFVNISRAKKVQLKDLFEKYKNTITPHKKGSKQEVNRLNGLTKRYGGYYLSQITPEIIVDDVFERLEEVKSETIRKDLNTLSHVIKTAMALWNYKIPANPVTTAREILSVTKALSSSEPRVRRLNQENEEEQKLERYSYGEMIDWIPWAIDTAMRRNETYLVAYAARKNHSLHLPGSITKTGKQRVIPMTERVQSIYEKRIDNLSDIKKFFLLKPDSATHAFQTICKNAGIEDLRLHDLRHEAISRLFEKGLSIPEVAAISGHEDWKSLKIYVQVLPDNISKKLRMQFG